MDISSWIEDVHQIALEHGWWDTNRDAREAVALMHSELSEALEEARAGRPMVWYACNSASEPDTPCMENGCGDYYEGTCTINTMGNKPEGIAVELVDCVIRIMDFMGHYGIGYVFKSLRFDSDASEDELPVLVCKLHLQLSELFANPGFPGYDVGIDPDSGRICELTTAGICFSNIIDRINGWIRRRGMDPEAILKEKVEYNRRRPYRHGKNF